MKKLLALVSMGILLSGCASIISGKTQVITVTSNTEGAEVSIVNLDNNQVFILGNTPFTGASPRISKAKLVVKKEGFKTAEIALSSETNMVFLVNILSSGVFGTSTDYSTGALYKYSPNAFLANLEPNRSALEIEKFRKESAVRVFAVMNYDCLSSDLAQGKGEYLNSLYELYNAKTTIQKNNVCSFAREAHAQSSSVTDFASVLVSKI
jgi:hypothetical protein